MGFAEFQRTLSQNVFKGCGKIVVIIIADNGCDFGNRQLIVGQKITGIKHFDKVDVFCNGFAGFFFKNLRKVFFADV